MTLPRDADDQAAATTPLPLGDERPGDLYFFARPGRRIHHVGIVAPSRDGGSRRMLHACYRQRRVVAEPLPPTGWPPWSARTGSDRTRNAALTACGAPSRLVGQRRASASSRRRSRET